MKVCKKCQKEFPSRCKIQNKIYNLGGRSYCLDCSPHKKGNCYRLTKNDKENKTCDKCKRKMNRSQFGLNGRYHNRFCKDCYNPMQRDKMKKQKIELVTYKGGQCEICGYNKCLSVLQFHHKDPREKDFEICTKNGCNTDILKKEVDKCLLLCANCHLELHHKNR
jgi:hypothetical protein